MVSRFPLVWSILALALAAACTVERGASKPDGDGPSYAQECSQCHGSEDSPAPPLDTRGEDARTFRGVGAHQAHLSGRIGADVACGDCHVVPEAVDSLGHVDTSLPAEVAFGGRAKLRGANPNTWYPAATDRNAPVTCRNTYCHGQSLSGGTDKIPTWNADDPAPFAACGACHGMPPQATESGVAHPNSTLCGKCHPNASEDGKAITDRTRHVNGVVDVVAAGCSACHGSAANAAPPVDTQGNTDVADDRVGLHQAHLNAAHGLAAPVACAECHVVPGFAAAEGHLDGEPTLAWGDLARKEGATPAFDPTTRTCTGSYCHGATLAGGRKDPAPWNQEDADARSCDACHGYPPPAPHPAATQCSLCHSTAAAGGGIERPAQHIDGILQAAGGNACNSCHGNEVNAAPPVDTLGRSDTGLRSVGAHQAHLRATHGLTSPVACATCHKVPATVSDTGHGNGTVEVQMTGLATLDGATPAWDAGATTCSGSYCHGATLGGGINKTPSWNQPQGTELTCGSCHGFPPPAPHTQSTLCSQCHDTAGEGAVIAKPAQHVDGDVQVAGTGCTSCHGSVDNPAPPLDTAGNSDTALISVGAHQTHLRATLGIGNPVPCGACHPVPADVTDPGHMDGTVQVPFGNTAKADGAQPSWDRTTATCSGTYCHGATLAGGTVTAPLWNKVDGSQTTCGTCHSLPPPPPHVPSQRCDLCHTETIGAGNQWKDRTKHVDGTVQVAAGQNCSSCHGSAGSAAPPLDTNGRSDTALRSVGAHQAHVNAKITDPVACGDCHVVPASVDAPGHVDDNPAVTFGDLPKADGATPAWDAASATCTNTYCHGATRSGGAVTAPLWTKVDGTQSKCDSCHGFPPPPPHSPSVACSNCHGDTINADGTFADKTRHINGVVDRQATLACNSCHGSAANAAPPFDTLGRSATTLRGVGAHQAHLASDVSTAVPCGECHVVPQAQDDGHIDGSPAVTFGSLSTRGGATPTWDGTAATCAGAYCHGATLSAGGAATTPLWTKVDGTQSQCGACHGFPPPAPHVQNPACGNCHTATINPDGSFKDKAFHVDGTVQVADQTCTSCHGNVQNAAPPTDTSGRSDTTFRTVGAHQAHLQALAGLSSPIPCTECHVVPATTDAAGHIDGVAGAEVAFGALTRTGGSTPAWTVAGTCTNTWCHGAKLASGTITVPNWTAVDGTQARCGTCHGMAPNTRRHNLHVGGLGKSCAECHNGVATGTSAATGGITTPALHVNGTVTLAFLQGGTWDAGTRKCGTTCHDGELKDW